MLRVAGPLSLLLASSFVAPSLLAQTPPPIEFDDATREAGLLRVGVDPGFLMGAGGAFVDIDEDGYEDVVVNGPKFSPWVYESRGDGTFVDATARSGIAPNLGTTRGMGVHGADYDNDGDTDLFIANWGPSKLYRNNAYGGGGAGPKKRFADATSAAGVFINRFTTGAAWGDYDNDGFLDLYVGNYIKVLNFPNHTPWDNNLFHNRGDGRFTDVTNGCRVGAGGTTLAVSFSDVDEDGDMDLWVGNDFGRFVQPNQLFRNDGGTDPAAWGFVDVAAAAGSNLAIYCMGIAAGDIDRDLDLDYYFTNLGKNGLLRNDGPNQLTDVTDAAGVGAEFDPYQAPLFATSWGCGFHDFDRDGWVDLYVSNGHIPAADFIANSVNTPNSLFRNLGTGAGTFVDVSAPAGVEDGGIGRGVAFADFDKDGDVDVLQVNANGPVVRLFRNESRNERRWLRVLPQGRRVARDAIGTRVTAHLDAFSLVREANPSYSFESTSDPAVMFGLGDENEVRHLHVRWLSGVTQDLYHVGVDRSITLEEPLLILDRGGPFSTKGTVGIPYTASLRLTNVDRNRHHARLTFECRSGDFLFREELDTFDVPPRHAMDVVETFTIPNPGPGGASTMELTWTVEDEVGAVESFQKVIMLVP